MNILITAGGTSEPIDSVRRITNTSTGRLATIIHKAWVDHMSEQQRPYTIHYVVTESALLPREDVHTVIHKVSDTFSVQETIHLLLETYTIDVCIHLMAISDYYVDQVHSTEDLARNLHQLILSRNEAGLDVSQEDIEELLTRKNDYVNKSKKISSKSDLILHLGQTPKIISSIKTLSPKTKLVGFKLLSHVTEEELIDVATKSGHRNHCEFVVANDLQYINGKQHKAILVKDHQVLERCETKEDIALAIIKELTP